jgi:hypothetical protein
VAIGNGERIAGKLQSPVVLNCLGIDTIMWNQQKQRQHVYQLALRGNVAQVSGCHASYFEQMASVQKERETDTFPIFRKPDEKMDDS